MDEKVDALRRKVRSLRRSFRNRRPLLKALDAFDKKLQKAVTSSDDAKVSSFFHELLILETAMPRDDDDNDVDVMVPLKILSCRESFSFAVQSWLQEPSARHKYVLCVTDGLVRCRETAEVGIVRDHFIGLYGAVKPALAGGGAEAIASPLANLPPSRRAEATAAYDLKSLHALIARLPSLIPDRTSDDYYVVWGLLDEAIQLLGASTVADIARNAAVRRCVHAALTFVLQDQSVFASDAPLRDKYALFPLALVDLKAPVLRRAYRKAIEASKRYGMASNAAAKRTFFPEDKSDEVAWRSYCDFFHGPAQRELLRAHYRNTCAAQDAVFRKISGTEPTGGVSSSADEEALPSVDPAKRFAASVSLSVSPRSDDADGTPLSADVCRCVNVAAPNEQRQHVRDALSLETMRSDVEHVQKVPSHGEATTSVAPLHFLFLKPTSSPQQWPQMFFEIFKSFLATPCGVLQLVPFDDADNADDADDADAPWVMKDALEEGFKLLEDSSRAKLQTRTVVMRLNEPQQQCAWEAAGWCPAPSAIRVPLIAPLEDKQTVQEALLLACHESAEVVRLAIAKGRGEETQGIQERLRQFRTARRAYWSRRMPSPASANGPSMAKAALPSFLGGALSAPSGGAQPGEGLSTESWLKIIRAAAKGLHKTSKKNRRIIEASLSAAVHVANAYWWRGDVDQFKTQVDLLEGSVKHLRAVGQFKKTSMPTVLPVPDVQSCEAAPAVKAWWEASQNDPFAADEKRYQVSPATTKHVTWTRKAVLCVVHTSPNAPPLEWEYGERVLENACDDALRVAVRSGYTTFGVGVPTYYEEKKQPLTQRRRLQDLALVVSLLYQPAGLPKTGTRLNRRVDPKLKSLLQRRVGQTNDNDNSKTIIVPSIPSASMIPKRKLIPKAKADEGKEVEEEELEVEDVEEEEIEEEWEGEGVEEEEDQVTKLLPTAAAAAKEVEEFTNDLNEILKDFPLPEGNLEALARTKKVTLRDGTTFTYTGHMNSKGEPNGHGVFFFPSGEEYYKGDFLNGKMHGQGEKILYRNKNGVITYKGTFAHDAMEGEGEIRNSIDGSTYVGNMKGNKENGPGMRVWPNEMVYVGNWKDGHMDGEGTIKWQNGATYEGFFQKGQRHGKGVMTWPEGGRLEGTFDKDKPHGEALRTYADGTRKVENWNHGTRMDVEELKEEELEEFKEEELEELEALEKLEEVEGSSGDHASNYTSFNNFRDEEAAIEEETFLDDVIRLPPNVTQEDDSLLDPKLTEVIQRAKKMEELNTSHGWRRELTERLEDEAAVANAERGVALPKDFDAAQHEFNLKDAALKSRQTAQHEFDLKNAALKSRQAARRALLHADKVHTKTAPGSAGYAERLAVLNSIDANQGDGFLDTLPSESPPLTIVVDIGEEDAFSFSGTYAWDKKGAFYRSIDGKKKRFLYSEKGLWAFTQSEDNMKDGKGRVVSVNYGSDPSTITEWKQYSKTKKQWFPSDVIITPKAEAAVDEEFSLKAKINANDAAEDVDKMLSNWLLNAVHDALVKFRDTGESLDKKMEWKRITKNEHKLNDVKEMDKGKSESDVLKDMHHNLDYSRNFDDLIETCMLQAFVQREKMYRSLNKVGYDLLLRDLYVLRVFEYAESAFELKHKKEDAAKALNYANEIRDYILPQLNVKGLRSYTSFTSEHETEFKSLTSSSTSSTPSYATQIEPIIKFAALAFIAAGFAGVATEALSMDQIIEDLIYFVRNFVETMVAKEVSAPDVINVIKQIKEEVPALDIIDGIKQINS